MSISKYRKQYDLKFKLDAIVLVKEKGVSLSQVAEEKNITPGMLHKWIKKNTNGTHSKNKLEEIIEIHENDIKYLKAELKYYKKRFEILHTIIKKILVKNLPEMLE